MQSNGSLVFLFVFLAIFINAPWSLASAKKFANSDKRSSLFELYTSEGCSSCPPAEKYFNRMKTDGRLFKQVFPLAFHVEYWDYIGWKDRLADKSFTQRQRAITRGQGKTTIYTPGVYRNSLIWESWRRTAKRPPALTKDTTGTLKVSIDEGRDEKRANISYEGSEKENLRFYWALLSMDVKTKIAKGERRGESAAHHFSVLGYGVKSAKSSQTQLVLSRQVKDFEAKAAVFWVTKENSDFPLQITGGFL